MVVIIIWILGPDWFRYLDAAMEFSPAAHYDDPPLLSSWTFPKQTFLPSLSDAFTFTMPGA